MKPAIRRDNVLKNSHNTIDTPSPICVNSFAHTFHALGVGDLETNLSKRERQIVEAIYQLGEATAKEIGEALPAELANATVRTQLRILEEKGVVKHRVEGKRFIYRPAISRQKAAKSALRRLLDTFFGGSVEDAVATHLSDPKTKLSAAQIRRLRELIDNHEQSER